MAKVKTVSHVVPAEKADVVNRCVAKFIDFLIAGAASQLIRLVGPLAGLAYLLIADGFPGGRSLGKRLIGLRVVEKDSGEACVYSKSILRNLPIGLVFLFAMIPFIGWVLFFTVGLIIVLFEGYLMYTDEGGDIVGDILAHTKVISEKTDD